MKNMPGSKMQIHCYKHNGKIHRTWDEIIILEETKDYIVCANNKVNITESDGRSHKTKETAIIFLYKKRWFHVTAQYKKVGLYYKVDMASPIIEDDNVYKYIDYDLDVKIFPDGVHKILDRNEYKFHRKIMNYSKNLDFILKKELTSLLEMIQEKNGPFSKEEINKYYQRYLEMSENQEQH